MPGELRIPNRFESLQECFGQDIRPLIVPIDQDLRMIVGLRDRAQVQNGGILCFILGATGVGKTTAVHSAAVHMPEVFAPVMSVPPEIRLRDAIGWVTKHLPKASPERSVLVLFDGREVSDDEIGLQQLLAALNQLLRRRKDVLFCWPTTDAEWHKQIRGLAEKVGGANFAPVESDLVVEGPPSGEWPTALERLLLQFGKTYDDVGIGSDFVGEACAEVATIGDFLTRIGQAVAERLTRTREVKRLPQVVFVVTSSGDVAGEANRIRRAGTQALAPEPLIGHSPRSEAGKWWAERNKNANHHLGYMISLLDARLVTMSASAVVYACMQCGAEDLRKAATERGARPDKGNAQRTVEVSEFFRFLLGQQIPEFTSGKKGGLTDATRDAFAAIQSLSATRHKAINQALWQLTREHLKDVEFDEGRFEVAQGGDLQSDAIVSSTDRSYTLEFHHLSEGQCKAASMSSYVMEKLRTYAWYHQLIPR